MMPTGFNLKTLNLSHIDEIYNLICNHYIEDDQSLITISYPKSFIYWYLKLSPPGLIIGLCHKQKLLGLITAVVFNMVISELKTQVPYINFWCVQKKVRNSGLGRYLMVEMEQRLKEANMGPALLANTIPSDNSFSACRDFAIPINYEMLSSIGFLPENISLDKVVDNHLHLMKKGDLEQVIPKLDKFSSKFHLRPNFALDGPHLLVPRKDIVYSFVKKDNGVITDFISVYRANWCCVGSAEIAGKEQIISSAYISFYFHESMSLTELVTHLLDKLSSYHIDQLIVRQMADNSTINITRFATHQKFYYQYLKLKQLDPSQMLLFPL